jgi:hypothetical protein
MPPKSTEVISSHRIATSVRPVNPVLQPMLRSRHGRNGVNHGRSGTQRQQPRGVLAAGCGPMEAKRSVRRVVLPGGGPESDRPTQMGGIANVDNC